MKKTLLAALAAGALSLGACSVPTEGEVDATTTATPTTSTVERVAKADSVATSQAVMPPASGESTSDRAYLETIEEAGIYLDRDEALLVGDVVCEFLDDGGDPYALIAGLAMNPYDRPIPTVSNEDLPSVMGAAIGALCPRHMELIR